MNTSEKRLSKLTLFAYGMGDFASNLCWTFIGSYLSVFYTDVVGMAPAIASAIMLIAKIWDGVNDPMFGAIGRTHQYQEGTLPPVYSVRSTDSGCVVRSGIYHDREGKCGSYLRGNYIYWMWHGLYGCKPFLRFLVYRYDNESGGYCAAEQLENDGNEFKLCSTQCDYRAAFDEIFRRLRKLHRRRLHKGGNFICDLCFAIVLFCICKLQGNHQAGSRCYQGIRWNKYQNSIIK